MVKQLETGWRQYYAMRNRLSTINRILLVLTLFFACATLGAALALFTGWPIAILSAMSAFLCVQQILAGFCRRRDRRETAKELAHLRRISIEFEAGLQETRGRLGELGGLIEQRTSAQSKKIVSELHQLEDMVRDFAQRLPIKSALGSEIGGDAKKPRRIQEANFSDWNGDRELLDMVRSSLHENRVDLLLQPIIGLPQRKLRHYEALSRLRTDKGEIIMPSQYIKVAAPAGLMSVVDNLLLFRCVQIVRRIAQKNRDIAVFCNISAETLTDKEFFPQFLDYMQANRDLSGQIVFEFTQQGVQKAGPQGEQNLSALAKTGFGLSMDHVESLAMDYLRLKSIGFRHLKVRASTLTRGMSKAGALVTAEDFKTLLSRHGISLIAEYVEDEKTVVQLLDYAVDYAQGFLFGEPRSVRVDRLDVPTAQRPAPVVALRRAG